MEKEDAVKRKSSTGKCGEVDTGYKKRAFHETKRLS